MKRFFAVFMSVIFLLSLTSCAGNGKTETENSSSESQEAEFKNTVSSAVILNLFGKAETAYGYFTSYSTIETVGDDTDINGDIYRNVENDDFCSVDTLKQYLLGIFDENLTEQLMSRQTQKGNPYFIDTDYDLYSVKDIFGMFRYDIYDKKYVVNQTSETELTLSVTIMYTGDDGNYDCTQDYSLQYIDDKWVFTDFKFPYDIVMENIG